MGNLGENSRIVICKSRSRLHNLSVSSNSPQTKDKQMENVTRTDLENMVSGETLHGNGFQIYCWMIGKFEFTNPQVTKVDGGVRKMLTLIKLHNTAE